MMAIRRLTDGRSSPLVENVPAGSHDLALQLTEPSTGGEVEVRCTDHEGRPVRLALEHGAVCTTTSGRRHWSGPEGERHHLIDPATGTSTDHDLELVTVVASTAARAEVIAKAAFIAGPVEAGAVIESMGGAGVLVRAGDPAIFTASLPIFLR